MAGWLASHECSAHQLGSRQRNQESKANAADTSSGLVLPARRVRWIVSRRRNSCRSPALPCSAHNFISRMFRRNNVNGNPSIALAPNYSSPPCHPTSDLRIPRRLTSPSSHRGNYNNVRDPQHGHLLVQPLCAPAEPVHDAVALSASSAIAPVPASARRRTNRACPRRKAACRYFACGSWPATEREWSVSLSLTAGVVVWVSSGEGARAAEFGGWLRSGDGERA